MPPPTHPALTLPMTRSAVLDQYFLEHRAKLLDLAAFLDRLDRATGEADFRAAALQRVLPLLHDGQTHRARRILERLSDPTDQPLDAAPTDSASGAARG